MTTAVAEWVDSAAAAARIGVPQHVIRRLAKRRLISSRRIPGARPAYSLADCEHVARAAIIRPAAEAEQHT